MHCSVIKKDRARLTGILKILRPWYTRSARQQGPDGRYKVLSYCCPQVGQILIQINCGDVTALLPKTQVLWDIIRHVQLEIATGNSGKPSALYSECSNLLWRMQVTIYQSASRNNPKYFNLQEQNSCYVPIFQSTCSYSKMGVLKRWFEWMVFTFLSEFQRKEGKAIPLQAWTGPEDSRRLRLPDFKSIGTWSW